MMGYLSLYLVGSAPAVDALMQAIALFGGAFHRHLESKAEMAIPRRTMSPSSPAAT
jgi:hypothetical protein